MEFGSHGALYKSPGWNLILEACQRTTFGTPQRHNVSAVHLKFVATEPIAAHCEPCSSWCSSTICTARSRTSGAITGIYGQPDRNMRVGAPAVAWVPGTLLLTRGHACRWLPLNADLRVDDPAAPAAPGRAVVNRAACRVPALRASIPAASARCADCALRLPPRQGCAWRGVGQEPRHQKSTAPRGCFEVIAARAVGLWAMAADRADRCAFGLQSAPAPIVVSRRRGRLRNRRRRCAGLWGTCRWCGAFPRLAALSGSPCLAYARGLLRQGTLAGPCCRRCAAPARASRLTGGCAAPLTPPRAPAAGVSFRNMTRRERRCFGSTTQRRHPCLPLMRC